jgi:hypothetical protein
MFGIFNDLAKAAVGVVSLPVTLAEDVVTMGGALTDKETPYTVERLEDIMKNIGNAVKPTK